MHKMEKFDIYHSWRFFFPWLSIWKSQLTPDQEKVILVVKSPKDLSYNLITHSIIQTFLVLPLKCGIVFGFSIICLRNSEQVISPKFLMENNKLHIPHFLYI